MHTHATSLMVGFCRIRRRCQRKKETAKIIRQQKTDRETDLTVVERTIPVKLISNLLRLLVVICRQQSRWAWEGVSDKNKNEARRAEAISQLTNLCTGIRSQPPPISPHPFRCSFACVLLWNQIYLVHNVPFDNITPIYLINLPWKLGLGLRLDLKMHYFSIFHGE